MNSYRISVFYVLLSILCVHVRSGETTAYPIYWFSIGFIKGFGGSGSPPAWEGIGGVEHGSHPDFTDCHGI